MKASSSISSSVAEISFLWSSGLTASNYQINDSLREAREDSNLLNELPEAWCLGFVVVE